MELFASQITQIYSHYLKIASIKRLEERRIKRYHPLLILYDSLTETPQTIMLVRCKETLL